MNIFWQTNSQNINHHQKIIFVSIKKHIPRLYAIVKVLIQLKLLLSARQKTLPLHDFSIVKQQILFCLYSTL